MSNRVKGKKTQTSVRNTKSDLIQYQTGNRLRHASGLVLSTRYIYKPDLCAQFCMVLTFEIWAIICPDFRCFQIMDVPYFGCPVFWSTLYFFSLSAFLWNFFLCQDHWHSDVPLHLVQPCCVALGRAFDSGLISRLVFDAFVFWVPLPTHCNLLSLKFLQDGQSAVVSLNGTQIVMNNMARSRAPLPGFSSFVWKQKQKHKNICASSVRQI